MSLRVACLACLGVLALGCAPAYQTPPQYAYPDDANYYSDWTAEDQARYEASLRSPIAQPPDRPAYPAQTPPAVAASAAPQPLAETSPPPVPQAAPADQSPPPPPASASAPPPPAPAGDYVWVPGHWVYYSTGYVWLAGAWVLRPNANAYYWYGPRYRWWQLYGYRYGYRPYYPYYYSPYGGYGGWGYGGYYRHYRRSAPRSARVVPGRGRTTVVRPRGIPGSRTTVVRPRATPRHRTTVVRPRATPRHRSRTTVVSPRRSSPSRSRPSFRSSGGRHSGGHHSGGRSARSVPFR